MVFFSQNCTSWKEPCDMGVIATFKKQYKYLYLKDILDFYKLVEGLKELKIELKKRLRRGAAVGFYINPVYLLDTASCVKTAWNLVL